MNARYYSPELMRFINRDSCDLPNRYAYGNDDPIDNVDPSGHSAVGCLANIGISILAGIAASYIPVCGIPLLGLALETLAGGVGAGAGEAAQEAVSNKFKMNNVLKQAGIGLGVGLLAGIASQSVKAYSTAVIRKLGDENLLKVIQNSADNMSEVEGGIYAGVIQDGYHAKSFCVNIDGSTNPTCFIVKGVIPEDEEESSCMKNIFGKFNISKPCLGTRRASVIQTKDIISILKIDSTDFDCRKFISNTASAAVEEMGYFSMFYRKHNCRELSRFTMKQFKDLSDSSTAGIELTGI